ncbi:hypothetical protein [Burkholderia cepacia]|uniref:hypothetical protein n=1 Tax=Burkholderia cepacia TaxID=292 RepID=UPI00398F3FD6
MIQRILKCQEYPSLRDYVVAKLAYDRGAIQASDDGLNTVSIDYVRRHSGSILGRRIHNNVKQTFIELPIHGDHLTTVA